MSICARCGAVELPLCRKAYFWGIVRSSNKEDDMKNGMALQNAEFAAMRELAEQWERHTMTAVVDDDYPSVRAGYERALTAFLAACKANGRTM